MDVLQPVNAGTNPLKPVNSDGLMDEDKIIHESRFVFELENAKSFGKTHCTVSGRGIVWFFWFMRI